MSEPVPAFLDRLWGPWLGTRTPPLRGPSAASPSKVASPSASPGQPRFLSDGVIQEPLGSTVGGDLVALVQCVMSLINSVIFFFFNLRMVI